jgi:deazaflavin-dependent oxidoreductase (nitroreductase family)
VPEPGDLDFGYLTTTGRITGRSHEIEIWFALHDRTVYLLSGGRDGSDWVLNLMASPEVKFRIGDLTRTTTARVVEARTDEDALARRLLVDKYTTRDPDDLGEWGRTALPVVIEWGPEPPALRKLL